MYVLIYLSLIKSHKGLGVYNIIEIILQVILWSAGSYIENIVIND